MSIAAYKLDGSQLQVAPGLGGGCLIHEAVRQPFFLSRTEEINLEKKVESHEMQTLRSPKIGCESLDVNASV